MIKKDWIKKVKSVHPKSDEQVLQFIYDFRTMQKSEAAEEAIYTQFESGYCYYFAHMLSLRSSAVRYAGRRLMAIWSGWMMTSFRMIFPE